MTDKPVDPPVEPPDQQVLTATFPVEVVPLIKVRGAFTPAFWGVKHMLGFLEKYVPDNPEDDPPPPVGGTPVAARNVIPFRRKTHAVSRPAYASSAMPMRRAA